MIAIKTLSFLILTMTVASADDSTIKSDLMAGEKFADQYYRPPPQTTTAINLISWVAKNSPEVRSGSTYFRAGAFYQIYVQSTACFLCISPSPEQGSLENVFLEELWKDASSALKESGLTPEQFSTLTSDGSALKLKTDPIPNAVKDAGGH